MSGSLEPGRLAGRLLRASDWFNDALLDRLVARGWPRINRSQSLVFLHLGPGELRPAELARRVGISRQSMQLLLESLESAELVSERGHPDDRRAKLIALTERGHELAAVAARELRALERELARRIGADEVEALRRIMAADWGQPPR